MTHPRPDTILRWNSTYAAGPQNGSNSKERQECRVFLFLDPLRTDHRPNLVSPRCVEDGFVSLSRYTLRPRRLKIKASRRSCLYFPAAPVYSCSNTTLTFYRLAPGTILTIIEPPRYSDDHRTRRQDILQTDEGGSEGHKHVRCTTQAPEIDGRHSHSDEESCNP